MGAGCCLAEVQRVLKPGGQIIVHTAPNRWYDAYAYPVVRALRTAMGQGAKYPSNPRALNVEINTEVHVNEQDILRMRRYLVRATFHERAASGWTRRRKTAAKAPCSARCGMSPLIGCRSPGSSSAKSSPSVKNRNKRPQAASSPCRRLRRQAQKHHVKKISSRKHPESAA